MCGIVGGYWQNPDQGLQARLVSALKKLSHRGPDDEGFESFSSDLSAVVLGHTRLSIIDLSTGGHQPMKSSEGRYVMVFNGEIYNYRELRDELSRLGCIFKSDSDTEVLLQAWIFWGESCLMRLEGMFAFVVYDSYLHTLTCVRDAFGIKPFFYSEGEGRFVFASELKAVLCLNGERPKADWQRSYDYLVHGDYDSQEYTFVEGVKHLLPGHSLVVDIKEGKCLSPRCWWKPEVIQANDMKFEDAAEAVREHFLHNVKIHLRSDVALGAALSGGIDSSAVVCAMRYIEPDMHIDTFSYIAKGTPVSEEKWVDLVNISSRATGHQVTASSDELVRDLDNMIDAQGEPFGSTNIYAQYRVFQLAKEKGIKVTLDGQGADELLAGYVGYPGYRLLSLIEEKRFLDANNFARKWGGWPSRNYKLAYMYLGRILLPNALYRLARKFLGRDFAPTWLDVDLMKHAGVELMESRVPLDPKKSCRRVIEQLSTSLQCRGLPGLLRHGDRNSMRFSIESRVPFLTVNLVKLLYSLPEDYLISSKGETKSIFRAAMRGIVPDEILDRKDKIGFETPEQQWLFNMADQIRVWLKSSGDIPFVKKNDLIKSFEAVVQGKSQFSWQVWRWINYIRWHDKLVGNC